jgi:NAD(P)-dependent dehydrogenase (short-subunit alcohol dehydrogenase family)
VALLEDKAVVVTGAGRGLGRAYAEQAAAAGALVIVNDIDLDEAEQVAHGIRGAGGTALASGASVADAEGAQGLIRRCVEEFGRIDGLVNNAGLAHHALPWDEDFERVRRMVEVNVLGSLFCAIAASRPMREQASGTIINVTSGAHMGLATSSIYGATKGAVASLTYSLAIDLRSSGIRVNAISPVAETRMGPPRPRDRPMPAPAAIAPLVVYLLSDLAAGVTGQVVRLTGDELSLISPPRMLTPPARRASWTAQAIGHEFDTTFHDLLRPVGMDAATYTGMPSP